MSTNETLALVIIEQEKQNKTGFLDLGNCGLTEVPEALAELVWLEELLLGTWYINQHDDLVPSRNSGKPNDIAALPNWLSKLQSLHRLGLGGLTPENWALDDLSRLSGLGNLQRLYCSHTRVADLSPLAGLGKLQWLDCSNTQITDLSAVSPKILAGLPVIWDESSPYYEHRITAIPFTLWMFVFMSYKFILSKTILTHPAEIQSAESTHTALS